VVVVVVVVEFEMVEEEDDEEKNPVGQDEVVRQVPFRTRLEGFEQEVQ
jgi:hypothetical protein